MIALAAVTEEEDEDAIQELDAAIAKKRRSKDRDLPSRLGIADWVK